ncbi:MAG: HEAT repeat domain-containing protein [Sandaracinaceae bacterium]
MTLGDELAALFRAEREMAAAEARVLGHDASALATALSAAVEEAEGLDEHDEAVRRLQRLADLCAQVPGPEPVRCLLRILAHPEPAVRVEAGEALRDVAFERFKEVARAVEGALADGREDLAMEELPFVLTEVRDPDPVPLLGRFLAAKRAEVVAATIEALADYGDPAAVALLSPLVDDDREATLEDLEEDVVRVGDLAAEAIRDLGGE